MTKKHIITVALLLLGLVIIAFFGMRVLHDYEKFNGHRPPTPGKVETDVELIRDWMTVPFVSQMYRIPEKTLFDALGISPDSNHDKSLKDIEQDFYPNADGYVLEQVKKTILAHPASRPPRPDASRAPSAVPPLTSTVTP